MTARKTLRTSVEMLLDRSLRRIILHLNHVLRAWSQIVLNRKTGPDLKAIHERLSLRIVNSPRRSGDNMKSSRWWRQLGAKIGNEKTNRKKKNDSRETGQIERHRCQTAGSWNKKFHTLQVTGAACVSSRGVIQDVAMVRKQREPILQQIW